MEPFQNTPLKTFSVDKSGWTSSQHRLWFFLNTKQDSFFPAKFWPAWAQELIVLAHKSDSQMYNLMFFFLANGVYPPTAKRWVRSADYKDGELRNGVYKDKELADMSRVVIRAARGDLFTGEKKVWSMHEQRPRLM